MGPLNQLKDLLPVMQQLQGMSQSRTQQAFAGPSMEADKTFKQAQAELARAQADQANAATPNLAFQGLLESIRGLESMKGTHPGEAVLRTKQFRNLGLPEGSFQMHDPRALFPLFAKAFSGESLSQEELALLNRDYSGFGALILEQLNK